MKVRVIDGACVLSVAKSPGAAPTALGGASFMPQLRGEHKFNYGTSLKFAPRQSLGSVHHLSADTALHQSERSAAELQHLAEETSPGAAFRSS
jgi:hypothetical protein